MIRWTFLFLDEGNVVQDVIETDKDKDKAIEKAVLKNDGKCLVVSGENRNIYVNMALVKCSVRDVVPDPIPGEITEKPVAE